MERLGNTSNLTLRANSRLSQLVWLAAGTLLISAAQAQGPLAAKINVTPLASYTGSNPLPKPDKILVYDFAIDPDDVQVDKMQSTSSPPPHNRRPEAGRYRRQREQEVLSGTGEGPGEDRHPR